MTVSVVIPTLDGAATLPAVLDRIAEQRAVGEVEVVAVDSGSTDGTVELLQGRVDRLLQIAPQEFDHGLTRNRGIAASRGELVVLLVQDAVPDSQSWLAELTRPLLADATLAGTFARQLPRPGASRVTRLALGRWVAAEEEPHTSALESAETLHRMAPAERLRLCAFDNVCSCLRRSVWEDHPFRSAPIAEDLEWGKEVLLHRYRLAYVPSAAVVHSHERSLRSELERTRLVHRRLVELFELRTIPSAAHLLRALAVTVGDHLRCLASPAQPRPALGEVARTLALAGVWPLGQYLGGRAPSGRARG